MAINAGKQSKKPQVQAVPKPIEQDVEMVEANQYVQPDPSNQQKPQVQVQQPEQKVETKVVKPKTWRQMTPPGPNTDSSLSTPTRLKGDGTAVVKMSYGNKTFLSTKQMQNGIREDVKELFDLPGFPYYEDNMFTDSGQPYYTTY